jgi:ABC-type multidrug transport system ATPase subunit
MRMIAGFITPSSGTVSVSGHDVLQDPVRAKACIGYMPEGAPSYGEMTVAEFLDFIADLRGLRGGHRSGRKSTVIERLALAPRDPVQGLPQARGARTGAHPRPAGADPRRTHRWPGSESKA